MNIDNLIQKTPLLLNKYDPAVIKVGDFYLPYSTGFEIECSLKPNKSTVDFSHIDNLIDIDVNSYNEQRFRIPNGIVGLQTLEEVSYALVQNALLNPDSGIHYHIDCTKEYDLFTKDIVKDNEKWMLEELDEWEYKGTYNRRGVSFTGYHSGTWIRFQNGFKTMEFRIGEMTFNYELLFKRIISANAIVRKFKDNLNVNILGRYKDDYSNELKNRIIKI